MLPYGRYRPVHQDSTCTYSGTSDCTQLRHRSTVTTKDLELVKVAHEKDIKYLTEKMHKDNEGLQTSSRKDMENLWALL